MGKVEILTLIAGVVLSIALALIVVPMFSDSGKMSKKHQVNVELLAIKDAVKAKKVTEGKIDGEDRWPAYIQFLDGMKLDEDDNDLLLSKVEDISFSLIKIKDGLIELEISDSNKLYNDRDNIKVCEDYTFDGESEGIHLCNIKYE